MEDSRSVCLAGNPNVGKSTLFNLLTGLRQHTGNWTGKTVDPAAGGWTRNGVRYRITDLPGVYSLEGGTPEERAAADWLDRAAPDCLVVILDATALERSLRLALELRARSDRLLVCLNLLDEAERLGLRPDPAVLARALQAPVVCTRLDRRRSAEDLRAAIEAVCAGGPFPAAVSLPEGSSGSVESSAPEGFSVSEGSFAPEAGEAERKAAPSPGGMTESYALPGLSEAERLRVRLVQAAGIAALASPLPPARRRDWDRLVLGRFTAWPLVLALLFGIFWLTVYGANAPSRWLQRLFDLIGEQLGAWLSPLPLGLRRLLLEGVWGTTAAVTAVMLPPMAIFFPLFTLLEDLGWLPRAALLLDRPFAWAGTCGRQGLTMCMGCGCNAVGVMGCRIIPGRRQRLAAVVTNALTPCNGRFPTLILLSGFLLSAGARRSAALTAAWLTGLTALSAAVTLGVTRLLRRTLLRGQEGRFVLELPPFRRPRVGRVLVRSVLDRTLHVLGRAVTVAAPAGALIWLLANLRLGGAPLLGALAARMEPAAALLGLSGPLLLAFVLSFPANELLLPLTVLITTAGSSLQTGLGEGRLAELLAAGGLGWKTALCAMLFCLFHWPCSTTLLTIRRETGSLKWTLRAFWIPTAVGIILCAVANQILRLV